MRTKKDYLSELRTRCLTLVSLKETVINLEQDLKGAELLNLHSAADHARAEIITQRFYDKVPANVWHLVLRDNSCTE
ncbi:Hha/YmoA family nucleoid-associated regulatory protein [Citrobacter freundii]|uniref:Hha/YmoA family nucleoid-associated regulatory protein n=1 Tax=Citrobacter freundii TaxID=546 RepID=UPI0019082F7C|nr:Hha/YmoA family nucleoid-associated regulatory protein [Citrobacter freundii]MBJ8931649.1 hypothetical protein [Citrobacter freundii]